MGTEKHPTQRNSGYRETSDTEEQWIQRNIRHKGTVGTEKHQTQRNSGHRETSDTEEKWAQRNSGHSGTVGTAEQWAQRNSGYRRTVCIEGYTWNRRPRQTTTNPYNGIKPLVPQHSICQGKCFFSSNASISEIEHVLVELIKDPHYYNNDQSTYLCCGA